MTTAHAPHSSWQSPQDAFDHDYLELRIRAIEIAAMLDRLDRARSAHPDARSLDDDDRLRRCHEALELLTLESESPNRAERIALIFSD